MCSKLTTKTPKQLQWRRSGVFIVNFEQVLHLFLLFLLSTVNMLILRNNMKECHQTATSGITCQQILPYGSTRVNIAKCHEIEQ